MAATDSEHSCYLVTLEEAENILGTSISGVVTGEGFCTWLSEGPVFVINLSEYQSKDQARGRMAADRRRREREGMTVTNIRGFGDSAERAVSRRSIELSVLDGTRVIQLAVAGDHVTPSPYEERIGSLMKSLLSRRPAH